MLQTAGQNWSPLSIRVRSSTAQLNTIADIQIGVPTVARDAVGRHVGVPLITVRAIRDGRLDHDAVQAIADAGVAEDPRYQVKARDLLIPARSTSLQAAMVPEGLAGAVFNATLIRIRCTSDRLAPALLKAYFDHPEGRAQVESVSQSGTHQMNITVSALGELEIPLPDPDRQAALIAALQSAELACTAGIETAQLRRDVARDIIIRQMCGESRRPGGPS